MSRHPEVKWAQRVDKIFVTVLLPDAKNAKVNLEPDGVFTFSASAGAEDHFYELKLDLHDKVNVEESKINIGVRSIFCIVEKAEQKWWKKLVREDQKTPHYVKVDWDKWADEDDDAGPADLDLGGMDFSNFGNMEGMGMGDDAMGNMEGMDDDSDDEDQEEMSKQEGQDTIKEGGGAKPGDTDKMEGEALEGKAEAAPST